MTTTEARAGGWRHGDPARAPGEPAAAFLTRRAAQHPPATEGLPQGLPDPAEALLAEADALEAAALDRTPFAEVWAMWESGDLTQPVFTAYCSAARRHRAFAHPFGYCEGAPRWTHAPCCAWEAVACGMSPSDLREVERRGGLRGDVLADYRQVWRRAAPRLSDTWEKHGRGPLRPRAAEALALLANPARRAPIDRSARAAFEARRWAASFGRR